MHTISQTPLITCLVSHLLAYSISHLVILTGVERTAIDELLGERDSEFAGSEPRVRGFAEGK